MESIKICSTCYQNKPISLYPKTPTGTRSYCKSCYTYKRWWERQFRLNAHNRAVRDWCNKNKLKRKQISKKWRDNNKEKQRLLSSNWKQNNKGKVREYCAARRKHSRLATPLWADRREMQHIHQLASDRGLYVDHIVPLNSEYVCGLNCEDNLRCIPRLLNEKKGNRYWPDMPEEIKPKPLLV